MKKRPLIYSPFAFFAAVGVAGAQTHDDFDDNGVADTPWLETGFGQGTLPEVLPGGYDGNFLRLIHDGEGSQNNQVAYDQTDTGIFGTVTVGFDFSFSSAGNPADGISMTLVPVDEFFPDGAGVPWGAGFPVAEEPNVAGIFSLALDLYNNINEVSTHFGVAHSQAQPAPDYFDLNSGSWHRAELTLEQVGNAMNAKVVMLPEVDLPGLEPITVLDGVVPGMVPYESRIQFHGRTGGAFVNADLDNIDASWSEPFDPATLPSIDPPNMVQDFDNVGGAAYAARQHNGPNGGTPNQMGPKIMAADPGSTGHFLRLSHDGLNNNNNSIWFDRNDEGALAMGAITYEWDFRMFKELEGDPADGYGVYLASTGPYGIAGIGAGGRGYEQGGLAGAVHIGFDIHPFAAGTNDIVLTVDNAELARIPVDPFEVDFMAGVFHHAKLDVVPVATGTLFTLTLTADVNGVPGDPYVVFENTEIPGLLPTDHRLHIGARTGGLNLSVDLDNIEGTSTAVPQTDFTRQDFEEMPTGTGFFGSASGGGDPAALVDVSDGIISTTALRLLHDGQNGSVNAVAFDQTVDGTLGGDQLVIADFDFRIESLTGAPADGFSLRFVPVDTFGTSGPGAGFEAAPGSGINVGLAEEPNIEGVLAIGFDLHPAADVNDVSVHWDGFEEVNETLDPGVLDLDDGAWHHVRVIWSGSVVSVVLDDTVVIADALDIIGLDLYAYRLEFAGRTGGLNMTVDLDNIFAAATDVTNEDTDGDGLLNVWEEQNGLNPLVGTGDDGADGDPDGDGSPNSQEQERATNPKVADTDMDGIRDGAETGDGNFVSTDATGTDPLNPDTDGDGLQDGVENPLLPYDPGNAATQPGTSPFLADTDNDTYSDSGEVNAGTDPTDENSKPVLAPNVVLKEDFDVFNHNSVYELANYGGTPASIATAPNAENGKALQLTERAGSTNNAAVWDFVNYSSDAIELSFQFFMTPDQGNQEADGFGVGLFDTGVYGETGVFDPRAGGGAPFENPLGGVGFLDALYVGFDIYAGGADPENNNVRVTGLGGSGDLLENIQPVFTLNSGEWHSASIVLKSDGAGGGLVSVTLTEDIYGLNLGPAEDIVLEDAAVPGLDPTTWQGRVAFGGRTGGLVVQTLIDCVQIAQVTDGGGGDGGDFRITDFAYDSVLNTVDLTWSSEDGANYRVESSLDNKTWTTVIPSIASGGATTSVNGLDVEPPGQAQFFFRVVKL